MDSSFSMSHQAFIVDKSILIDDENDDCKDRSNTNTDHN